MSETNETSKPTILAIVPARKGSSFKNKNIRHCHGKELVCWTLDACKDVGLETLVSTDDTTVEALATSGYGFETERREKSLCNATATLDAVLYSISLTHHADIYVLLPPTSPLRTAEHITDALEMFRLSNADSLITVTEEHRSIWRNEGGGFGHPVRPITVNRQSVEPYYIANGAMFIVRKATLQHTKKKVGGRVILYPMDASSSVDVHNSHDLALAEFLIQRRIMDGVKEAAQANSKGTTHEDLNYRI